VSPASEAANTRRRFRREDSLLGPREPAPAASPADGDPDRTQTFDPVEPSNE
jgi:hypothetical protein